jgi:DnaA family protein
MKQIPLPIGPQPQPGFGNFLPGDNAAAVAHLRELALPAAPVYLWGPAGSGKSHLLRALAARCQSAGLRVGWFDAADSPPWTLQPDWALVVIDRCEALSAAAQHAAFALFVEAATHGVQVAGAGRLPPVDLPVREDLRTRLGWGHVFALQPLPEADTRAALRREADHRGIFLSDEVMHHLLTHFPRDLSHLMHLLDRLDDYALAQGRRVTVPLLRQMLQEAPEASTAPEPQAPRCAEIAPE